MEVAPPGGRIGAGYERGKTFCRLEKKKNKFGNRHEPCGRHLWTERIPASAKRGSFKISRLPLKEELIESVSCCKRKSNSCDFRIFGPAVTDGGHLLKGFHLSGVRTSSVHSFSFISSRQTFSRQILWKTNSFGLWVQDEAKWGPFVIVRLGDYYSWADTASADDSTGCLFFHYFPFAHYRPCLYIDVCVSRWFAL